MPRALPLLIALAGFLSITGCEPPTPAPEAVVITAVSTYPEFTGLDAVKAQAAEGNADAQYFLELMPKAIAGDAQAQFEMANMYRDGIGIAPDSPSAFFWFQQAAERNHAIAQYFLGLMYENGESVPTNREEALRWYTLSAEQGDASGKSKLAELTAQQ
ncbi:MAG TPA: tetratricopeptide repeat protein [Pseudomonadales bacterium]